MLRTTMVLLAMLLATPIGAQLRTICSSPTMDYCARWWTYDYTVEIRGTGPDGITASMHTLRTTIELFGPGYEAGSHGFYAMAFTEQWADELLMGSLDVNRPVGPGFYETEDASGRAFREDPTVYLASYEPSLSDIRFVRFASDARCSTARFAVPDTGAVCYEVPEPAGYLLAASGLFLLGIVRVRRHYRELRKEPMKSVVWP